MGFYEYNPLKVKPLVPGPKFCLSYVFQAFVEMIFFGETYDNCSS